MYKITCSLEWSDTKAEIAKRVRRLGYYPEINIWLNNITTMVNKLNQLEVTARQLKKSYVTETQLKMINDALEELDLHVLTLELST